MAKASVKRKGNPGKPVKVGAVTFRNLAAAVESKGLNYQKVLYQLKKGVALNVALSKSTYEPKKTLASVAREAGMNYATLYQRVKKLGVSPAKAAKAKVTRGRKPGSKNKPKVSEPVVAVQEQIAA